MIPYGSITGTHPVKLGSTNPAVRLAQVLYTATAVAVLGSLACPGPGTVLGFFVGAGSALENMRVQDAYSRSRVH